jgi:hypothetical protein
VAVVDAKDFDISIFDKYEILKRKKRKKGSRDYLDVITAFDIESSRLDDIEQSVMYIWQWQIGDDLTVVGHYWDDWISILKAFAERYESWLVVYVHNLSYEFSFLKGVYEFMPDEVFCMDSRKILKCEMFDHIEYRCSYLLTNMSLDKFLKKFNVENKKLTYDYSKIRYPWTHLSDEEMAYCINDVKGLVQALKKQMLSDGDTLSSIPLTATGYVRRDVKEAMKNFNHNQLKEMMPSVKVYRALREAFRGGDTLSNRWNTDEIIKNVKSCDIVSSYPSSMLMNRFPMSRFILEDPDDFDRLLSLGTKALLFRVIFIGIRLHDNTEGHAYLSRDKCREIVNGTFANGRILNADYLETTITDVDYDIISRRYVWTDRIVFKLWSSNYGMLPLEFRNVIINYYKVKTELKGVDEGTDDYLFYMKNKEKLNSTYGMTVEAIKDEIIFEGGEFRMGDKPLWDLVRQHNARAFLNYAWGVWTTCWSRKRLADGIDVVTHNGEDPFNFIYSDTDSIKYIGDVDFTEYNSRIEKEALKCGAYAADRNGEVHYMGVYEDEGYRKPNRFKTLGAKKYVFEDPEKKLHITIAGVNKRLGGDELGKLENFKEGFIFTKAGGTESLFNDDIYLELTREGHELIVTDNVLIRDSTYTLGITADYRRILDGLIDIKYSDHDIEGLYKVKD